MVVPEPRPDMPPSGASTDAVTSCPEQAFKFTYVSDTHGKGGQHTNGPDYGVMRCEHEATKTAIELHTHQTRGPHHARTLALTLCQMAVAEIVR